MLSRLMTIGVLISFVPLLTNGLPCVPNICENGGSCQDNVQWYLCHCVNGFIGRHCEKTGSGIQITEPPPIANCSSDIHKSTSSLYEMVDWVNPSPLNPENVYLVFQSHLSQSSFFPVGETPVYYIFADDFANIANCSFKIILSSAGDVTPPDVTYCPMNIHRVVPVNGPEEVEVFWEQPRAEDNAGVATITRQSAFPGQTFRVNTQTAILYEFSDEAGNVARCSFTVVVIEGDNIPPDIQGCPSNIVVTISNQFSSSLVSWVEPTSDEDTVKIERSHDSGSLFTLGDTVVTYNFTDLEGLSAVCTFVVSIIHETSMADDLPPTITNCPADLILDPDPVTGEAVATWTPPSVEDDSPVSLLNEPPPPGTSFPAGFTTDVTYVYSDMSGNAATCSFSITVNELVPPFACPENMTIEIQADDVGTNPTWNEPTISEPGFFLVGSRLPGSFIEAGVTVITYSLYDHGGLLSECSFSVNIVQVKDVTPPEVFNCPTLGVSITFEPGVTSGKVFWPEPVAEDDSGPAFLKSQTAFPGDTFEAGETTVIYIFEDSSGNVARCMFNVSVKDVTPPEVFNCPTLGVSITFEPGVTSGKVFWPEPVAEDDSGPAFLKSQTAFPGDTFEAGETTVIYIFEDSSGNVARCMFNVSAITVVDTSPPVISNCPVNITVHVFPDWPDPAVQWTIPSASDVSSVRLVPETHHPGDIFPRGGTVITYIFVDETGNFATCTFGIFVTEIERPDVVMCPSTISIGIETGLTGTTVTWEEPYVTTELNLQDTRRSHVPGSRFPVGQTNVTYSFIFTEVPDFELNCTFFINVMEVDEIPPRVIYCPGNIKRLINNPLMLPNISWLEPLVTDDSGNVSTSLQSHISGTIFPEGVTDILYQFMDESKNVAECTFKVTVQFMRAALIIPVTFDIEEEFTADLLVTNSSAYTAMEERLRNGISGVVMSRRQLRNTFGGLSVIQLSPGSIVAETDLWFHSSIPVNDVTLFVDNLFRNSLTNSFGFLGDLRIKSIDIGMPEVGATTPASATTAVLSTSTKTSSTTLSTTTTSATTTTTAISTTQIISTIEGNETSTMKQTTDDIVKTTTKETPPEQEPVIGLLSIVILTPVVASVLILIISILICACRVCCKDEKTPEHRKPRSSRNRRTADHPLGMVTEPTDDSSTDGDAREEERYINIKRQFEIIDKEVEGEDVHSGEEAKEDEDNTALRVHVV